jgi:hypothetical protein
MACEVENPKTLWNYGLGARDRNQRREQRRANMSDCEGFNVELRRVRESTTR